MGRNFIQIPPGRSSEGQAKFQCSWPGCVKKFLRAAHLENHVNGVHKKIKPYGCPAPGCDVSCSVLSNLRYHMKKKHPHFMLKVSATDNAEQK